ncbi:MAG: hypothetical protein ACFCU2_06645 [Acidimicrobiia bacterium]
MHRARIGVIVALVVLGVGLAAVVLLSDPPIEVPEAVAEEGAD